MARFNPKAVRGYNKRYRKLQGARAVRRVRARVPARTYGRTRVRSIPPRGGGQHGASVPRGTRPRPKGQRGIVMPSGKVGFPHRDEHAAARAVEVYGYKGAAKRYGAGAAALGRTRIKVKRAHQAARSARTSAEHVFSPGVLNMSIGTPRFRYAAERRGAQAAKAQTSLFGRSATPQLKLAKPPPVIPVPKRIAKLYRPKVAKHIAKEQSTAARLSQQEEKALAKVKPKPRSGFLNDLKKAAKGALTAGPVGILTNKDEQKLILKDLPKVAKKAGEKIAPAAGKGFSPIATPGVKTASILGIPGSTKAEKISETLGKRTAQDISEMLGQAPATAYYTGKAVAQSVAQGKPSKDLKRIVHQVKTQDPIALGLQGKFKKAGKQIYRHPGYFAAEVVPGGKALDIGAGAGARLVARGDQRLVRAVSRERAPRVAQSTGMASERRYSRGLVQKRVQVAKEKRQAAESKGLYRKAAKEGAVARDRTLPPEVRTAARKRKVELRQKARETHPQYMKGTEIKRRVSRGVGTAEVRRRANRGMAEVDIKRALKTDHPDVATMVAQGIVKPTVSSLEDYAASIASKHPHLTEVEKVANEHTHQVLTKAIEDINKGGAPVADEIRAAAKRYHAVVMPRHEELMRLGVVPESKGKLAPLIPYAKRYMGAEFDHATGRLMVGDRELKAAEIEQHIRAHDHVEGGPKDIAFFSQRPPLRRSAFFKKGGKPAQLPFGTRTGAATEAGTNVGSLEGARATAAEQQGLIDVAHDYRDFLQEQAMRTPTKKGRIAWTGSRAAAEKRLRQMAERGNEEWVAVPLRPRHGTGVQAADILRNERPHELLPIRKAMEGEGSARYTLIRKDAHDRMMEHLNKLGEGAGNRALRMGAQQFKAAVLTTTLTWPTGNIAEAALRTGLRRAGPMSYLHGRAILKDLEEIDPRAAQELRIRLGHGHFGSAELDTIHTTIQDFKGSRGEEIAKLLERLRHAPVAEQAATGWKFYTSKIFDLNARAEKQFHYALLGRYAKSEMPQLMGQAAKDAAKGLRGTNAQYSAAEWVVDAYGRYDSFEPGTQFVKAHYAPFVAWTMNAAKFLLQQLPRDHPLAASLLAVSTRASEDWRKQHGFDIVPAWMQGMVPIGGNKLRVAGRYTPFGLAADPVGTLGSLFPLSGLIMNSQGLDWKGAPLGGAQRSSDVPNSEKVKAALGTVIGMFVPAAAPWQKIQGKGLKTLNPVRTFPFDPKTERAFNRLSAAEAALKKTKPGTPAAKRALQARGRARWGVHQATGGKYFGGMKGPGDFQIYISPKGSKAAKARSKEQSRRRGGSPSGGDWYGGGGGGGSSSGGGSSGGGDWFK